MALEWTDTALDDVKALRDYIGKDSPHYARQFVERIFEIVEQLEEQPRMGRRVPEARRDDIRELIFQDYRIVYRTQPDRVQVITVIHGSRMLRAGQFE
ncbi:MAG: type II toxin-antitoxin system RelE/ParE family toxin [Gammaproteobacteria bacterium]